MIENIKWNDAHVLPDDNTTVLLFAPASDEPVWIGYHEDKKWYVADGFTMQTGAVTHWANLPWGPNANHLSNGYLDAAKQQTRDKDRPQGLFN